MSVESASVEILLETLMERFETLRTQRPKKMRVPMQAEIRSLDFWRSIVAECLASFFLIFIVCGSFIPWSGHSPPSIGIALAAGFAVASLTLTFAHVSGNPPLFFVKNFQFFFIFFNFFLLLCFSPQLAT